MATTPDPLVTCVALEAVLCESLLEVAREQGAILERGGDAAQLASLEARKRALVRSLAGIERDAAPLKRPGWVAEAAPAQRERLDALLDFILATIEALAAQERHNARLLRLRGAPLPEEVWA